MSNARGSLVHIHQISSLSVTTRRILRTARTAVGTGLLHLPFFKNTLQPRARSEMVLECHVHIFAVF